LYINVDNLRKPTDQIVDPGNKSKKDREKSDNKPGNDQFEFRIPLFVRRRKLVLRKIWRRAI